MNGDLAVQKSALRKEIRARLAEMSDAERATGGGRLVTQIREHPAWAKARTILFFFPMTGEPDIRPLMEEVLHEGKIAALPHFSESNGAYIVRRVRQLNGDLTAGRYGVYEPASSCEELALNRLDLSLVPGIGFDVKGRRLGRGKGHYDRLLAHIGGQKCGVAFDVQIVDAIPAGPHDIRLNCIVTPTRWIET